MKRKNKILTIVAIVIITFILLIIGIVIKHKNNYYEIKTGNINEEVIIKDISAKLVSIELKDYSSFVTVELKNISKKNLEIDAIKLYLFDENNNEITNFVDFVNKTIEPGNTINAYAALDMMLENVKYVSYEILKEDN